MAAQYKKETDVRISITVKIKPEGSMLEQEEQMGVAVAEVGRLATALSLQGYDTSGEPIVLSNEQYTSRGQEKKVPTPVGSNRSTKACVSEVIWRSDGGSDGA